MAWAGTIRVGDTVETERPGFLGLHEAEVEEVDAWGITGALVIRFADGCDAHRLKSEVYLVKQAAATPAASR